MLHAHAYVPAPALGGRDTADSVVLNFEDRRRRRGTVTTLGGLEILVDLAEAPALGHGDAYELEDGRLVEIVAEAEELIEIRAATPGELVRLAWHLGNRHLETEIGPKWLRIRRDHVIADMLRGLGAKVVEIEGPFQPEGGAYAHGSASHDHRGRARGQAHSHGAHSHGEHDHGEHGHGHSHDHGHAHDHGHSHDHGHARDHGHSHDHAHDHAHDPAHDPAHADHAHRTRHGADDTDPKRTGPADTRRDRMNDAPQYR